MNDQARQARDSITGLLREFALRESRKIRNEGHAKGFKSAAGIALRRIQGKLDGFKEQMTGPGLNKVDQAVYARLEELKSEIEADCERYWRGSGIEWRLPRPSARALQTENSLSED